MIDKYVFGEGALEMLSVQKEYKQGKNKMANQFLVQTNVLWVEEHVNSSIWTQGTPKF